MGNPKKLEEKEKLGVKTVYSWEVQPLQRTE